MREPGDPIVVAEHLGRRAGGRWLWRDVDLRIAPGDRVGVGGPSGIGKTLFLRALAALDPVDEGRILAGDVSVSGGAVPAYRARVVYVQQRPAVLPGTVADNLERPFALGQHRSKHFDRARAASLCAAFGMSDDLLDASADGLSGGEMQIVALVRALLLEPQVLLLDEPTSSLDASRVQHVESVIDSWMTEAPDRACLWVSHTEEQLERVVARRFDLAGAGE